VKSGKFSWQRQQHGGSAGGPGGLYDDAPAVPQLDADSFPAAGNGWLYLVSAITLHTVVHVSARTAAGFCSECLAMPSRGGVEEYS
jgi:hypothetical protein